MIFWLLNRVKINRIMPAELFGYAKIFVSTRKLFPTKLVYQIVIFKQNVRSLLNSNSVSLFV